jgi:branched-chain amino acid transport system substrate-binding protein
VRVTAGTTRAVGALAVLATVALIMASCSSSGSSSSSSSTEGGSGEAPEQISGVPGVTDTEIRFDVMGTQANNPQGACILDCYKQGVQAYFDYRNSEGGVAGRKLVVKNVLDDELSKNQERALDVTSANDVFGVFNATLLATGWQTLSDAGVPDFVWAIQFAEMTGNDNIWGQNPIVCGSCTNRGLPFLVKQAGAKNIASIGYGVTQNSKDAVNANAASIEKYSSDIGGAQVAYLNDTLEFGLANGVGPEVTAMKQAGVDFVSSALDVNGNITFAKEMERQGMGDVPIYLVAGYHDQAAVESASVLAGDYVGSYYRPFEADQNDMQKAYLDWMQKAGYPTSELSGVGWIDADIAFQGIKAAGSQFDRQKVTDAVNAMTAYSASGMIDPIDFSKSHNPPTADAPDTGGWAQECISPVKMAADGIYELVGDPAKPFFCWSNQNRDWSEPVPTNFD